MPDDFDWSGAGPHIVREARDTVAYLNGTGDVVIRQRPLSQDDEDVAVFVPVHRVKALIDRLDQLLLEAESR